MSNSKTLKKVDVSLWTFSIFQGSSDVYRYINVLIFQEVSSKTSSAMFSLDENIAHSNSSIPRNKKIKTKIKLATINVIASSKVVRSKIFLLL
tara:strand:- start:179 stop:457 length:279 start_codon:yes stop_codon:yes gene_type:complete